MSGQLSTSVHCVFGETDILTYLLTYLLTPCSRVLLEKLTGFAANQEIPRILWNNPKFHYRTHKRPPPVKQTSVQKSECVVSEKRIASNTQLSVVPRHRSVSFNYPTC
jgi:hypothetical protein